MEIILPAITNNNSPVGHLLPSIDRNIDAVWPMQGHDAVHSGRCVNSTEGNFGQDLWGYQAQGNFYGSPVIDSHGTIYFLSRSLYAIRNNGTLKWLYSSEGSTETAPAIDDDGTIYYGTSYGVDDRFFAINPDGTLKWFIPTEDIMASPVISPDGTIVFPNSNANQLVAVNPNGTKKWEFPTNHVIYSTPAIGPDDTVYVGSHDRYIYAVKPNGTLKWSFLTGAWVHGSPSIGSDGTVYCGSDDGYLYALDPANGSMKWCLQIGASYASPTIDSDGTLYIGVWEKKFYAINPNGTIRWIFDTSPGKVWGSTAALSGDGTLYFGTCDLEWSGGIEIIALWINGTVKWRKPLDTVFSSPAIGRDGTVYIGSRTSTGKGHLNAFGPLDPDAPSAPTIEGTPKGKIKTEYSFTFCSTDPLGKDVWYYVSWGDGTTQDWIGPYPSGETVTVSHRWEYKGAFTIEARAKNTDNLWGPWGSLSVTMPCSYDVPFMNLLEKILEQFPHAFPILRYILLK